MEYRNDCDKGNKVNLKAWLQDKNKRDGTSLAYITVFKWYKKFGEMHSMEEIVSNHTHSLKKIRRRPYQGEWGGCGNMNKCLHGQL